MEKTMSTSVDQSIQRSRKAQGAKSAEPDRRTSESRVKKTIVMDRRLESLLIAIAGFQDMDASELAVKLIDAGLKRSHGDLYDALQPFKPKISRKSKADASVDTTDRATEGLGVSGDAEQAA